MYLYLYDNFLNDNKFNKTLARIETRLTDLGIGGKISRLSPLKDIAELIKDEIRSGVRTIVAVGNDKTVIQIINETAEHNVTLGIIPIGADNYIAKVLGIPENEAACNILSARKVEKVDLGKVNGIYFLSNLIIPRQKDFNLARLTVECENSFNVIPETNQFQMYICNLKPAPVESAVPRLFNPQDGLLEVLIEPFAKTANLFNIFRKPLKNSVFPFRKISLLAKRSINVIADDQKILTTPLEVEVVPKKLKVIVGKERKF